MHAFLAVAKLLVYTYYIQAYVHIKTNKLDKFTVQNTVSDNMHTSNRSECKIRVNTTVSIAVLIKNAASPS